MKNSLTRADALILGGATLTLLFSFVGFTEWDNAWASGLRFISTLPALLSLGLIGISAAELAGNPLPDDLATFSPAQVKAVLATTAALVMLAWATSDIDKAFAFWVQLLGTICASTGAWAALTGRFLEPLMQPSAIPPPPGAPQPPGPPEAGDFTPPPPPPD